MIDFHILSFCVNSDPIKLCLLSWDKGFYLPKKYFWQDVFSFCPSSTIKLSVFKGIVKQPLLSTTFCPLSALVMVKGNALIFIVGLPDLLGINTLQDISKDTPEQHNLESPGSVESQFYFSSSAVVIAESWSSSIWLILHFTVNHTALTWDSEQYTYINFNSVVRTKTYLSFLSYLYCMNVWKHVYQ